MSESVTDYIYYLKRANKTLIWTKVLLSIIFHLSIFYRFERQMEADQKSFEDQKSKLLVDFSIEKNRLQSEIKQKELEYERRKDELVGDKDDVILRMKRDFKERLSQIENKNQVFIKAYSSLIIYIPHKHIILMGF